MKPKKIINLLGICLLVIPLILSLEASLLTPQATFRVNNSQTINYFVGVRNDNDFPINITIIPSEDLDITFLNEIKFVLQPNESRDVYYDLLAKKSQESYINVIFQGDKKNLALQSKINIIGNSSSLTYIFSILLIFIIIATILILLLLNII